MANFAKFAWGVLMAAKRVRKARTLVCIRDENRKGHNLCGKVSAIVTFGTLPKDMPKELREKVCTECMDEYNRRTLEMMAAQKP